MFWGRRQFRDITKDMCFVSPLMLNLRAKILQYFEGEWTSKSRQIFSTPVEMLGPNTVFSFKENCAEQQLFEAILKEKNWSDQFPKNVIPNLRNPHGHPRIDDSAPALWRTILWYFFTEPGVAPEYLTDWAQYRDLAYWAKLALYPKWSVYSELSYSSKELSLQMYADFVSKERDVLKVTYDIPRTDKTKPTFANPRKLFNNTKADGQGRPLVEEDFLELPALPTFAGALTEEESLKLISLMTAPYLRIPLILSFFAQNHVESLLTRNLRNIMEITVFETGHYSHNPNPVMSVPARDPGSLGVRYGLLVQELSTAPDATITPILSLLQQIVDLTNENKLFFKVLLLLIRMSTLIVNYYNWIEAGKFTYMQPSSVEYKRSEVLPNLKTFLLETVLPMLVKETVERKENPTRCFKIQTHIAMLCALDLDTDTSVMRLLCSFAHTTTWIGACCQSRSYRAKRRALWSFPLIDTFDLQHRLRERLLKFSALNPKMKEISQQMVHTVTYHHMYRTPEEIEASAGLEKTEEEKKQERREKKEESTWKEEIESWYAFKHWKPEYSLVWESEHPIVSPITLSHRFQFPGAKEITLSFNPKMELTSQYDIILTSSQGWGPVTLGQYKIQSLPGGHYRVPVNDVELYLDGNATSFRGWGLHVTATALVSDDSIERLQAAFEESQKSDSGAPKKATLYMCQRALCDTQKGGEGEALKYLIKNYEKLENEDKHDKTPGLFQNGKYVVDLQSFMVSLSEQEQMPTPPGMILFLRTLIF